MHLSQCSSNLLVLPLDETIVIQINDAQKFAFLHPSNFFWFDPHLQFYFHEKNKNKNKKGYIHRTGTFFSQLWGKGKAKCIFSTEKLPYHAKPMLAGASVLLNCSFDVLLLAVCASEYPNVRV